MTPKPELKFSSMDRRMMLRGIAGTTAVALTGSHLPHANAAGWGSAAAPTVVDLVPVTYYPPSMQKQFIENQKALQGKPFADLFRFDLTVPSAWAKAIQHGPLPASMTLRPSIEGVNKVVEMACKGPDFGYAVLEEGGAYCQSRIVMPYVTSEMFKWWFTWHQLDKTRYMLWFPHAHVDNYVADPRRLANTALTYEQRLYNNPNQVEEFVGPDSLKITITFRPPYELGLDENALRHAGFTTSASATVALAAAPYVPMILILHLCRDTPYGLELINRYWIGPYPEFTRFPGGEQAPAVAQAIGMNSTFLERIAYEMSIHDMTEFNQLAKILPFAYRRFRTAS